MAVTIGPLIDWRGLSRRPVACNRDEPIVIVNGTAMGERLLNDTTEAERSITMDNDLKAMTDGDIVPAAPAAMMHSEADAALAVPEPKQPAVPMTLEHAKQQVKDGAAELSQNAGDKAMMFAEQGKERAAVVLEQLSKLIEEAAAQVDEKLGGNNGQYIRTAAGTVHGFADQLRGQKVDDLVEKARTVVRKSPGLVLGAAAAIGFVVARLVSAGIDQRDS